MTTEQPGDMPVAAAAQRRERMNFAGTGSEYFRIWIVNLLLTLVTIGLYSPWAKVRKLRYIYGSTTLAEGRFDYHADPKRILFGRLIALAVFAGASIVQAVFPPFAPLVGLLFLLGVPPLIVLARMFNMRYTSYRNVRFGFNPAYGASYKAIYWYGLLAVLTLGAAVPYAHYQRNRFIVGNTRYGTLAWRMAEGSGPFFFAYFLTFLVGAVIVFPLAGYLAATLQPAEPGPGEDVLRMLVPAASAALAVMGYYVASAFLGGAVLKATVNATSLGAEADAEAPYRLGCDWSLNTLLLMYMTNAIAIVVSLGLLIPWAQMRVLRYQLSHTWVDTTRGLDEVAAAEAREVSAIGEELGDIFDVDIGL
ncbi:MAG: YjgN family protein [Gammaproteobacteria bacterium]|jgi:uncharacterized membrane protein YjgN (DUF898 family)|nr:YjgN family protein [Gammaproteobacteria bacterium]